MTANDYVISFLIHVIILFVFSFIALKQTDNFRELVIDWVTDINPPQQFQENFLPAGSPLSNNINQGIKDNQPSEQNPVSEKVSSQYTLAKSIEPPINKPLSSENSSPNPGISSSYISGLKSQLSGSQSGNSGFQLEDDDGNISVKKSVLPNPKITDFGRVTLQFKIKQDGSVNQESVIPVIIGDPIYTEASIKALKQWQFYVKRYISNKAYRITFIFNPE